MIFPWLPAFSELGPRCFPPSYHVRMGENQDLYWGEHLSEGRFDSPQAWGLPVQSKWSLGTDPRNHVPIQRDVAGCWDGVKFSCWLRWANFFGGYSPYDPHDSVDRSFQQWEQSCHCFAIFCGSNRAAFRAKNVAWHTKIGREGDWQIGNGWQWYCR